MALSSLPAHPQRDVALEQYMTDGEVAATWMQAIRDSGDLTVQSDDGERPATVCDLGAGNGVLGLAAVLCGAKRAWLVECDEAACSVAIAATERLGLTDVISVVHDRVLGRWDSGWTGGEAAITPDVIIMNPPWGRQTERADRAFLDAAFASPAGIIHVLHSAGASHIEGLAEAAGWTADRWLEGDLPLPAAYRHHEQRRGTTRCAMWRIRPQV